MPNNSTLKLQLVHNIKIPAVHIEERCMQKIKEYVKQMTVEVGWLGCVREEKDKDDNVKLTVYDVYAPEQTVTGATTDIESNGVVEYMTKAAAKGIDTDDVARYWGHSHVNMGVTPSGTDDQTLAEMVEQDERYFVMSIHNKNNASYCALYIGNGLVIKDVDITVDYIDNGVGDEVKKELEDNVTKHIVQPNKPTGANNVKPNTASASNPSKSTNTSKSTHSGSGSNWEQLSPDDVKNGNLKRNSLGLGHS